ncbi:acyltransferase-domain-containing protein [Suillus subalutaceus]|uniref:acyltransferase-domain-containing protein n=1 Tax=Suillus subalutaceus TaxID=48586 RepID=UPI001B886DAA|nr:acyltransferase-domain-containing protein [Suillus subalutaceus]KAG1874781.1 acyltransferase-domain-containing protein [Suillus subalutaceus]
MTTLLSTATITATGLLCKAFLNSGLCSITVSNLHILLDALRNDERRRNGQGVVTVANHISTLDDPLVWGTLPTELYLNSNTTRWSLGASDIMFTNPLFSAFFRKGQVLETFRGNGIFQPSIDIAIKQLNEGHWVHLFGEGKVNQPPDYPRTNGVARLPRFKWGVGRILMETAVPPLIIPMWLTGFDKLMPEHRSFPYKYFPRLGIRLGVVFGNPISVEEITAALSAHSYVPLVTEDGVESKLNNELHPGGCVCRTAMRAEEQFALGCERKRQMDVVRSDVTAIVQRAVEALGRQVSGNLLDNSRS